MRLPVLEFFTLLVTVVSIVIATEDNDLDLLDLPAGGSKQGYMDPFVLPFSGTPTLQRRQQSPSPGICAYPLVNCMGTSCCWLLPQQHEWMCPDWLLPKGLELLQYWRLLPGRGETLLKPLTGGPLAKLIQ
ncbi:hypothetical protein DM01DRAFT_323904 [Hesseltinella vesiculosa]|uniref:Hydrophobin n=1 Tax=Hesseltinella vesiculosa TaxID=101127 RepID=A0A1X2GE18_9FUNG|nr:hypothetical protein DM01DRAFT_323904 [Hesseltinella vesiculosa]